MPVVQWSPHAVYQGRQINVGPTGVRAWVDENHIIVTHVTKGSPACGILKPNDVIEGADRKLFKAGEDPRVALGNAISAAETKDGGGKLHLCVKRAGKLSDVVVPIRVMGSYGPNWPYDCAKSKRIVDEACAYLATRQYPDGSFPCEVGMATQWNGLLFLASGDAKYQDNARRCAQWLSDRTWEDAGLNCWPSGYSGVLLAEYYLATGDRSVLPTLQKLVTFIGKSQMACGSWGHNGPVGRLRRGQPGRARLPDGDGPGRAVRSGSRPGGPEARPGFLRTLRRQGLGPLRRPPALDGPERQRQERPGGRGVRAEGRLWQGWSASSATAWPAATNTASRATAAAISR